MRTMKTCLMIGLILLFSKAAKAENQPAKPTVTWATTLPAIELSHRPLETVLNELKAKLPGFDFSISRENVPHDYPQLPTMSVENITLTQFFNLVTSEIPGVVLEVTSPNESNFPAGSKSDIFCRFTVKPNTDVILDPPHVHVFGLAEIIAYRASLLPGDGDHARQASDDVLSLIQASLDEQNIAPKVEMKLHPATQVLICHVTLAQEELIKQVLAALQPSEAQQKWAAEQQRDAAINREMAAIRKAATRPTTQPQK